MGQAIKSFWTALRLRVLSPFWRTLRLPSLIVGGLIAIIVVNVAAGPGATVVSEGEAEGPQYRDPDTVDLKSIVTRRRDCPAASQRWAWRWEDPKGAPIPDSQVDKTSVQHLIPLQATVTPFLARSGAVLVTVSARDVPERLQKDAGWKYRVVTAEMCPLMPEFISQWFGPRLTVSKDQPLNFIGAPHGK